MLRLNDKYSICRTKLVAISLAVVLLAVGCTSDGSADTTNGFVEVDTTTITIDDFRFTPSATTVGVGDTVTWKNEQGVAHTTTSTDGVWDSGSLSTDASFGHTFDEAGEFAFFCAIHPSMTGTITVEG